MNTPPKTRAEREAELAQMIRTPGGRKDVVSEYLRITGLQPGTTISATVGFEQMAAAILAHEHPPA